MSVIEDVFERGRGVGGGRTFVRSRVGTVCVWIRWLVLFGYVTI